MANKESLPTEYYINPKSLITLKEIPAILKISISTISKLIKNKNFPPNVRICGERSVGRCAKKLYVYQEVMDFIEMTKKEGALPKYEETTKTNKPKKRYNDESLWRWKDD